MITEERLEKVERELAATRRRSRWLMAALGLALGAFGLAWIFAGPAPTLQAQVGAGAERVVRANRFVLEDENGKVRALLGVTAEGPGLILHDENGKIRIVLDVAKDVPELLLLDENGEIRAGLAVAKDVPGLALKDAAGKVRAWLAVSKAGPGLALYDIGGPGLSLWDAAGKPIWSAP